MGNLDPISFIAIVFVGFFAIGLHEYAHCKFADMAGDPTPGIYGRVTLNLFKHFEPVGTLMMLFTAVTGVGIGWGRAAPINPEKMRNPRWDTFVAVAAGPVTNLLQAVFWGLLARVLIAGGVTNLIEIYDHTELRSIAGAILYYGVYLNLSLAFFNLFPIPPLDGHWLLGLLLPENLQRKWFYYSRQYGWYVLIALVLIGQQNPSLSVFRLVRPLLLSMGRLLLPIPVLPEY